MSITAITRDFNSSPNIIRIQASDTLATMAGSGYITAQTDNINTLNNGTWEWLVGDLVLAQATDGDAFFQFNGSDFTTLIPMLVSGLTPSNTSGFIPVSSTSANMKWVKGAAAAGGSAAQSFTDTFCTSASIVLGVWQTQANPAQIQTIVPGNGSFVVNSTADAGAGTFNYLIIKS